MDGQAADTICGGLAALLLAVLIALIFELFHVGYSGLKLSFRLLYLCR
jgi:hypothetical protein